MGNGKWEMPAHPGSAGPDRGGDSYGSLLETFGSGDRDLLRQGNCLTTRLAVNSDKP